MSKIKVNEIENRTGSTLTLGKCGSSVNLAAGASQSGFGRTGTVDWCTTAKTSPFTSVNGKGYFVNTTSGAITVTLPSSPSGGDIIAIKDYARTFSCNAVTLCRNGSKMCGSCFNSTLDDKGTSATLIYVDGTKGWQLINDDATSQLGGSFTSATGGCVSTCGNFKIHTFKSSANFTVCSVGNAGGGGNKVSYMVVAGGGGTGGPGGTGAGGAGGFREGKDTPFDSYTASPLAAACSGLTITAATFPITIGAGGGCNSNGANSVFSTITSAGGGAGAGPPSSPVSYAGAAGGSGGGAHQGGSIPTPSGARPAQGGAGNTPPVSPPQGNPGGASSAGDNTGAGGGGGATSAGGNVSPGTPGTDGVGGPGGNGAGTAINPSGSVGTAGPSGSLRYYAGGGGGSHYGPPSYAGPNTPSPGGYGGGGNGGVWTVSPSPTLTGATDGTANTGGGAGGVVGPSNVKSGGSGIVIIRYKFQ